MGHNCRLAPTDMRLDGNVEFQFDSEKRLGLNNAYSVRKKEVESNGTYGSKKTHCCNTIKSNDLTIDTVSKDIPCFPPNSTCG